MPCRGIIMKGSLTPAEWKVIEIIYMVILVHFSHINFHYLFYYRMSYQPPTREIYFMYTSQMPHDLVDARRQPIEIYI